MKYKVHEVAALFPMLEPGSRIYNELEDHIKLFGQLDPIVVDGDMLLDGRNRLAICVANGIEPKIVEWSTLGIKNPQHEWIFGKNAARRSLTDAQRIAIYAEYDAWEVKNDARERSEAKQFKAGDPRQNPGGKPKAVVNLKSGSAQKRDAKEMHANSTVGRIADATGATRYRVEQALALVKAAASGDQEAKADLDAVKQGLKKFNQVSRKPRKPKRARVVARVELMPIPTKLVTVAASFEKWLGQWDDVPAARKIVGGILGRSAV